MIDNRYIENQVTTALKGITDKPFTVEGLVEKEDGVISVAVDVIGISRSTVLDTVINVFAKEGLRDIEAISPDIIPPESGVRVYAIV